MKYKIGDKVRIKSIHWYNENKDENGIVLVENGDYMFCKSDIEWCGRTVTIKEICLNEYYEITEDFGKYRWTDEMIEGLAEEEVDFIPKFGELSNNEPLDIPTMTTDFVKEHGLPCPEGYIFKDENGNVINATKIVLEKKKKEYPKNYEECAKVLLDRASVRNDFGYKGELLVALQKLLVCRDAYWKIAGDEIGLGKPWEPNWQDDTTHKFIIHAIKDKTHCGVSLVKNHLLAFPTEEMRDAFYDNFKEEIEICKELL